MMRSGCRQSTLATTVLLGYYFRAPGRGRTTRTAVTPDLGLQKLVSPKISELFTKSWAVKCLTLSCRFSKDLSSRTGKQVKSRWKLCWKFISPLIIFSVIVGGIVQMIRNGEFTYTAWDRTEVISGMLCFTLFHCGRWGDSLSCDMEINATSTDLHQTLTD